ncbi:hypothetical protein IEQ34_011028 [Dendrobium chrysotoxum]|uniref:Uncharacterized protein n=1 Tax=Dendrobium chrysotoxum TaxID=161865 RepID=A0AAV7GEZ5_DENCH|nr:hypothetical protein IEQ34_011028 [Dendrobium chrysotoxum]
MGGNTTNHPKLLITPPVLYADTTPAKLQNAGKDDGDKEAKEQHTRNIGELISPETEHNWNDKFPSEKTDGRQRTISYKREGSEWIDNGVYISQSLQPFETTTSITIPEWAMSAEENFDRTKSPPENLVKTIRKIDRS